mmetsp:Transcript_71452/g.232190  ORF Transcript_71452/g.232190 Transcript_71452/m.232190 type:complete len:379 (+) Transcript_71452:331-1467(+)
MDGGCLSAGGVASDGHRQVPEHHRRCHPGLRGRPRMDRRVHALAQPRWQGVDPDPGSKERVGLSEQRPGRRHPLRRHSAVHMAGADERPGRVVQHLLEGGLERRPVPRPRLRHHQLRHEHRPALPRRARRRPDLPLQRGPAVPHRWAGWREPEAGRFLAAPRAMRLARRQCSGRVCRRRGGYGLRLGLLSRGPGAQKLPLVLVPTLDGRADRRALDVAQHDPDNEHHNVHDEGCDRGQQRLRSRRGRGGAVVRSGWRLCGCRGAHRRRTASRPLHLRCWTALCGHPLGGRGADRRRPPPARAQRCPRAQLPLRRGAGPSRSARRGPLRGRRRARHALRVEVHAGPVRGRALQALLVPLEAAELHRGQRVCRRRGHLAA